MSARTVFEALLKYGHDEDFSPKPSEAYQPTSFSPGSNDKIEVLRRRVELGLPLWHPQDNLLCSVVVGGRPSNDGTYRKSARCFSSRLKKTLSE